MIEGEGGGGLVPSEVLRETKQRIRRNVRMLKCFHNEVLMRRIKYG